MPEPPLPAVLAGLAGDPRVPIWARRLVLAVIAAIAVTLWQNWRWGLTAAALVAIADTLYQSKAMSPVPADVLASSAQRRTRRRLHLLRPAGYLALHNRAIPGTDSVIDHLVIGPAGVFAVDSERWDRRMPVRTTAGGPGGQGVGLRGGQLFHGPYSQAPRLAHARWEAAQAAALISAGLGQDVPVSAAMVIYGPAIPWGIATLRGVEVFGGKKMRTYFRRKGRDTRGQHLTEDDISTLAEAASAALPPAEIAPPPARQPRRLAS